VYFVIERPFSGRVKIGYSKNPDRRLRELQTGSSRTLVIYSRIEGVTKEAEREIHNLCREHRRAGEWFDMSLFQVDSIVLTYRR
jgi:hypothetical protein